jgi:ornithine cyclodeaminase/alanine dehydrogenase
MSEQGTLLLSRQDISALLSFTDYMEIVENAFRLHADGKSLKPELIHVKSGDGEFHIKAGGLELNQLFFAVKVNGGFFNNRERFNMPNIQGSISLYDGQNGYPVAIMDSGEITIKRTGAVAAVAAKYLARPESSTATICGCGTQGRIQMIAMKTVLPIKRFYVFDVDATKASAFAKEMSEVLGLEVSSTNTLESIKRESDVIVTCTPSREPFLKTGHVPPGAFVAAMGADSPDKQELHPELLRHNKVVVDLLEQCANVGELHHAIALGMTEKEVYADLGAIVSKKAPGRTSNEEIIIFDSTGTALQDVAAAAAAYQKAVRVGLGQRVNFFK